MRLLISLLVLVLVSAGIASADQPAAPGSALQQYMLMAQNFGFSGSVLVVNDGRVVLRNGYGYAVRETSIANTAASIFEVGSLTKQFTAVAIAKLEAENRLSADDELSKYFPDAPADKAHITLRELLTHTSGIAVYGPGDDYFVMPRDKERAYLFEQPLGFKPGTSSRYSNGEYTLLAYIVEKVTGMPYEEYLRTAFFRPLNMPQTGDELPNWNAANATYSYFGGRPFSAAEFAQSYPYYGNIYGNGGIFSTLDDLHTWITSLANGQVLPTAEFQRVISPDPLSGYGYGWEIVSFEGTTKIVSHGGVSDFGYNSKVMWTPDGRSIVIVLSNTGEMLGGAIPRDMITPTLLRFALTGVAPKIPAVRFTMNGAPSSALAGSYRLSNGGSLIARVSDRSLILDPQSQAAIDALSSYDASTRARLNAETRTAISLLHEVAGGQCKIAIAVSKSHTAALCHGLGGRFSQLISANAGKVPQVTTLGTVPSWWDPDGTDATFIQVGGRAPVMFRIHWRNGLFDSLGGHQIANPLETPLRGTSSETFAGMNVGAGNFVRARFGCKRIDLTNALGVRFQMQHLSGHASSCTTGG